MRDCLLGYFFVFFLEVTQGHRNCLYSTEHASLSISDHTLARYSARVHVVRSTIKVNGKIWPPPPLNPLTDRHQNLPTWLRCGCLPFRKISSRSDKGFRFCACAILRIKLFTRLFFRFLGGLQIVYSQNARTDFDAKYVKRRGFAQGYAFWGSQNQKLSITPLFAPKPPFWGPFSTIPRKRL